MKNWTNDCKGTIDNWYTSGNSFAAPELSILVVCGDFNNKKIQTSKILDVDGAFIKTVNSVYKLGDPAPEFIQWLSDNNKSFDPKNPIKVLSRKKSN
jgi:hypothetical protein